MRKTGILTAVTASLALPIASMAQIVPVAPPQPVVPAQPVQVAPVQPGQVAPAQPSRPTATPDQNNNPRNRLTTDDQFQQQQENRRTSSAADYRGQQGNQTTGNQADRARFEAETARMAAGDLPGPIDSLRDMRDTARLAFMIADANGDHLVSQQEAIDAGNTLVGGFFFAADANGDGTLSQDEASKARERVMQQHPVLKYVLRRASQSEPIATAANENNNNNQNANQKNDLIRQIGSLLDGNSDKKLQANEIRDAVQVSVQTLYSTADKDGDSKMSPAEINAAFYGALREVPKLAFQAIDQNGDGNVNKDEMTQALVPPSHVVFDVLDQNRDGQLTQNELESAGEVVVRELENLKFPEPRNSPANVISSSINQDGTNN